MAMETEEAETTGRLLYSATVHETPKFELASYMTNYKGRTITRRLHLIASCCPPLREEAARLLLADAKRGSDVHIYQDAVALLNSIGKEELLDIAWLERKEKQNNAETARLESELKGYKNNLIKESIRMGNEDLGNHYLNIGDLGSALKAYSRMREFATTPAHIASTAFSIIAVGIEQANWLAVQSHVHKIRNLQMKPEDANRAEPKTAAASGLYQMCTGDYKEAAFSFIGTDPSLGDSYSEIISSNDVAVYGGLCALASMTRAELQSIVLENTSFRNFLELEPHIRRAINFFCASKYSQCLEILESYRADYLLDIYLQNHVANIYKLIRTKSIVQYFQPFSRVTLDAMARTFGPTPSRNANGSISIATTAPIEDELINLIENGLLPARIDLEARVLIAKESNLRADLHEAATETIDGFIREAKMKLIRVSVIRAGLEVQAPPTKGGRWSDMEGSGNHDSGSGLGHGLSLMGGVGSARGNGKGRA